MIRNYAYILLLLLAVMVCACSPESRSPIAKNYHNTTARYNGYFLAKERMKAVEATVANAAVNNYNQPLEILILPDANTIGTITPDLEEVIKKASFPIQRHKNSKWVDDSYILIGKARYYKEEYDEAINTFKYAATISKQDEAKHEALIWLMRTFMANKEYDDAVTAADFLKKQKLTKENRKLYYLTQAQYQTYLGDIPKVIEYLEFAVPTIDKKDEKSRIRFILAQLYQITGQDKKAYEHYSKILRRNPPYELGFYSKLNLGQVTELSNASDRARIEKYYRKLLKDAKNIEYRDKIYYEMAKFERKQNKFDQALTYLNNSARASKDNPTQKGYSYLLAGQIYYENLQNYRSAQAYYDSAAQVLPPTVPEYAGVVERRDILTEFTTQLTTIKTEDSLQVLARMDTAELNNRIDQLIAREQERQQKQAEALAQAATKNTENGENRAVFNTNNPDAAVTASVWYFDNPVALGTARTNFIKKWGDRQLQDNWRTVSQRASAGQDDALAAGKETAAADTLSPEEKAAGLRKSYLAGIPFGAEKLKLSDEKVEEALFALGNIYNLKLKEPAKAIETYEQLLSRYPETKHAAETYYTLYLLYKEAGDEKQHTYANLIRQKFPKSSFARLIDQPDYLEANSAQNKLIRQLYDSAFTLYEARKYKDAGALAEQITTKYPENEVSDKVSFLKVLLIAQTQKPPVLKDALQKFIESYPASNLLPRAQEMLDAFALYESGKLNKIEEPAPEPKKTAEAVAQTPATPAPVNYATDLNAPHYFILVYPKGNEAFSKILEKYSDYNRNFNKSDNLSVAPYILTDSLHLVVIRQFANAKAALNYRDKQKVSVSPVGTIKNVPFTTFVISDQNFPAFYRSKNLEEYLAYFRKNYLK